MSREQNTRRVVLVGLVALLPVLSGCSWGKKKTSTESVAQPVVLPPKPAPDPSRAVDNAKAFTRIGDLERAMAEFQRAIEINPELTEAQLGVGDLLANSGNWEAAEPYYATAARIEPRNYDAQYKHGLALHLLNRIAEAISAYLRAIDINPESFDANLHVATAYAQADQVNKAIPYAVRAVEIQPQNADARRNLASLYRAIDDHELAVTELQQAAELMELTPALLMDLADSLSQLHRYAEMAAALDQLVATQPSPGAYERLGFANFRMERYDDALANFERAVDMDADYYPALNGVAVCLLNKYILSKRQDNISLDRAVHLLRRSIRVKRNQPRVVDLLSRYG
jgi:tetratricopeptide (TPR) repeat protein